MSHPNEDLLDTFYRSFQQRDHQGMRRCYHPEAEFEDEVFRLRGERIGDMWQMLCERGEDLRLDYEVLAADEATGRAHWEPRYTFGATGREVHNVIDAEMSFRGGKIYRHRDRFDFWRWSRQALGGAGFLLGWTPWLKSKVARQAARGLEAFVARRDAAPEEAR